MDERVFVPKGWGYEDWIVNKEEYCGKLLFFKKGKSCSWHYHNLKDETFYVHKGELEVRYGWTNNKTNLNTEVTILKGWRYFSCPRWYETSNDRTNGC